MAFDDVTFFEVNLPSDVFESGRSRETGVRHADVEEGDGSDGSGGRSKVKILFAVLALVVVAFAVRKVRSRGSDEDVEMEYESPGVQVERTEP